MANSGFGVKKKSLFLIFGALVAIAAVSVLAGSGRKTEPAQASKVVGKLVAVEPLPAMDGELCLQAGAAASPANDNGSVFELAALQQAPAAAAQTKGGTPGAPSAALRAQVANRAPARIIKDSYPAYAAVAVDTAHNEVVLAAENILSLNIHDRTQNTPPNVRSEPRRMIHGLNTELEFVCGVHVDPTSGDVYAINNDTLDKMTVFSRTANGNAVPDRSLEVPMSAYGLAVDEKNQELMLTVEDDSAVSTFRKMASGSEPPIRLLQGDKTLLSWPHGITHDPTTDLIYVTNFGSRSKKAEPPAGVPRVGTLGRGFGKPNWPLSRAFNIPGQGEFTPPSITVYRRTAQGDTPPLRVIQGPKTLLNYPVAVAMDSDHGELFVANDTTSQILVFKADANGDVAPVRMLGGPKTGIKNPTGLAVDAKNQELWVTNLSNHNATVYKLSASGDTAPLRTIRGAPEGTPTPTMINVRLVYDTKRDELLVAS
jgi:DNA-binding beta-propeller fold protein YncE